MRLRSIGLAALSMALLPEFAFAQAPPKSGPEIAPKTQQRRSGPCAEPDAQAHIGRKGDVTVPTPGRQTLSGKLASSNGVICPPPQVDPEMRVPAPKRGGALQVIPPPGSPASAHPDLQPK